jgi:PH domain
LSTSREERDGTFSVVGSVDEVDSRVSDSTKGSLEELTSPKSPMITPSERQLHHRANNTLHVCWHRQTSLSIEDWHASGRHQLSGYLLRKFRNSTGWQKLWVVFANFCLYFFKGHQVRLEDNWCRREQDDVTGIGVLQEDAPLASLPLLGYSICEPSEEDAITKDNVFKLHYKTHYYFFRAESEYSFGR